MTHTHSLGLHWTRDQTAAGSCTYTTHSFHKSQTYMPPAGFEYTIPASEWPHAYAFGRAADAIGRVDTCGYTVQCYMQLF
jgi:hypothetical protein